ncbi:AraC-type DNA-binding protein [Chitinophaga sp. YR573]|uniref:helix-turn-helix transcriptional regulator n=1 Tax=Chitinophaga sp. YR573 TaxID=1881040 RepID=UPI0008D81962|nr:AraC family transcriptional regulator [Chitinophaga sp. YR573]SEW39132.1 AraC-type DNA-binding protein [Chitinophaga sp. YR573]
MNNLIQRPLCEQKHSVKDETGYQMEMDRLSFNQIDLKWASYVNPREKVLTYQPPRSAIVSHFRLQDANNTVTKSGQQLNEKQFVVFRESLKPYDLYVLPTLDKTRSFFELSISDDFFDHLFTEESKFLTRFRNSSFVQTPTFDFTAQMEPAMYGIINDMKKSPYSGYLKGIYLEAKAIELFLLQVKQLDQQTAIQQSKLKPADIERLHAVKDHIDSYYDQPCSITGLARMTGINQMKLKNGFKELFQTTVFGYLSDVRMQEAKRLLQDEKLYVNEVADRIGYKHAHHFALAFKKKFGILPGSLKE